MAQLGADPSESPVAAGDINSSFIGAPFGVERDSAIVYGRLAAVEQRSDRVTVYLDGVVDKETISYLELDPSTPVYFTTSDTLSQILYTVESMAKQ